MAELLGFDVNEFEEPLSKSGLAEAQRAGFHFCGVRVTMGLLGADSYDAHGEHNWRTLIDYGRMPFFGYCFGRPQPGRSGHAEADHLIDTILSYGGFPKGKCLSPVQDAEWDGGGDVAGYHRGFSGRVIERTRSKGGLYSGGWYWDGKGWAQAFSYGWSWPSLYGDAWRTARLRGFGPPPMIQRSGDGKGPGPHTVPGVGSNVDVNVFLGTPAQLAARCMGAAAPAPYPVLKRGARNADVGRLARNLHFLLDPNTAKPYYDPTPAGNQYTNRAYFTAGLEGALKVFQRVAGGGKLRATGRTDKPTWQTIALAIAHQKARHRSAAEPADLPRRGRSRLMAA